MSLKYAETQLTVIIIMWSGLTRDVDFSGHNVKFNRIVRICEQHVIKGLGSFAKKTQLNSGVFMSTRGNHPHTKAPAKYDCMNWTVYYKIKADPC